jgi:hypothetical protein
MKNHYSLISSKQYHHHHASIDTYEHTNRPNVVTVFYSYATPQVIIIKDDMKGAKVFQVDKKFSSTTTRQVNRFIKELNHTPEMLSVEKFSKLCKELSTGSLDPITEGALTSW